MKKLSLVLILLTCTIQINTKKVFAEQSNPESKDFLDATNFNKFFHNQTNQIITATIATILLGSVIYDIKKHDSKHLKKLYKKIKHGLKHLKNGAPDFAKFTAKHPKTGSFIIIGTVLSIGMPYDYYFHGKQESSTGKFLTVFFNFLKELDKSNQKNKMEALSFN